jgi:hypothetical protein
MHDYPITAHVEGDFSVDGKYFSTYLEAQEYRECLLDIRAEAMKRTQEMRQEEREEDHDPA